MFISPKCTEKPLLVMNFKIMLHIHDPRHITICDIQKNRSFIWYSINVT